MERDSSPPGSIASHVNSAYSHTGSTRHIVNVMDGPLDPPNAPFASGGLGTSSIGSGSSSPTTRNSGEVSLTVNYLPTKFSTSMLAGGGTRKRKNGKKMEPVEPKVPKRGGGVEAFRSGEARMPSEGDEEYDGTWFGGNPKDPGPTSKKLRWNRFKWLLFLANTMFSTYSIVALIFCLLTWFNIWSHADVILVANRSELVISTIAASFGVLTSLIGWAGILLNNRPFLAVYTFFCWITFGLIVIPGYLSYKRSVFNLEGKLNAQWSRTLGQAGRATIQTQLSCCGYFSPFVEATVTQTCYSRSILPGCKAAYMQFESMVLQRWYTVAFLMVPAQILVILAGLLCSNHVTYRFGKGMMPKAYRLSMNSMAVIMDNYANQLAEQYGTEVAADMLARSRSNINLDVPNTAALDAMPTMPYQPPTSTPNYYVKYDSINAQAPTEF